MSPLLQSPAVGTRLPALVLNGRGAGERAPRSHAVPSPGARWTLLVLDPREQPWVDEHRTLLAAEAVAAIAVAGPCRGAVLLDPQGVVQFIGADAEEGLDAVRAFRMGLLRPIPFEDSRPGGFRCAAEGRRRRRPATMRRFAA